MFDNSVEFVERCLLHPDQIIYRSFAWQGHFGGEYVPCLRCWLGEAAQYDGYPTNKEKP